MSTENADAALPGAAPDLGWSLGVILRRWHEMVELALDDLPHGTRGFQVLSVISQGEPPTQSALAKHLNIDKTVMPYLIDALESAGLVERHVDAKDRRAKRIVITALGSSVLAKLESKVRDAEQDVLGDIPPSARSAFASQAERLALSIHAGPAPAETCTDVIDALEVPGVLPRA